MAQKRTTVNAFSAKSKNKIYKRMACILVMAGLSLLPSFAQAAGASIVVGQSLNLGPDSDGGGLRIEAATKGYIASINAAGGIKGRSIELVSLNDDGNPKLHIQNLKVLAEKRGAVAFMNCQDDAICQSAAETATKLQVPLVGTISGLKSLSIADSGWVFRVRPDYEREARVLGKQLLSMACSRVAIVTDAQDSELVNVMRTSLTSEGLTATVIKIGPDTTTTEAALNSLSKTSYHAAVIAVSLNTMEWMMDHQIPKRPQWPRVIASVSSNHLQTLLAGFQSHSFGFTYVVPNPEIQDRLLTQEFQRTMDKYGAGHSSTFLGMEAYINAKLLVEALKRAPQPDPKSVAISLQTMGNIDLGGFSVSFANNPGSGSSWVDIGVRSRDGHLLR